MARKKPSAIGRLTVTVVFGLLGLSAYQYYDQQVITWHRDALSFLNDLAADIEFFGQNDQQAPFVIERSQPTDSAGSSQQSSNVGIDDRYSEPGDPRFELVGRVSRVIDGDSLEVRVAGNEFPVRLYGIDSPEHDQPHGRDAARELTRKIERRTVLINIVDIDQYGRLVGTVYQQGQNINLAMVAEGHGWWYRQYAESENQLEDAEKMAREAGLGLWSAAEPIAPWDWRRAN